MIEKTIELFVAVVLFCVGLTIAAWLVTKLGNFVAKLGDKK